MSKFQRFAVAFQHLFGDHDHAFARNVALAVVYLSAGDMVYRGWRFITSPEEPSNIALRSDVVALNNTILQKNSARFEKLESAIEEVNLDDVVEKNDCRISRLTKVVDLQNRSIEEKQKILKEASKDLERFLKGPSRGSGVKGSSS